jgi:hypothetical protein
MKLSIKRWLGGAGIGLLLGGVSLFTAGCGEPAVYGTGYYGGGYDYDYYPGANVYYYPQGGYYNWYDHGHWRGGRHLPPNYTFGNGYHERFHSRTREPWKERGHESREYEHHDEHH